MLGRVSLNPLKHIDPVGTILIPLTLILAGSPYLVGYAKPVPVNFGRLQNPRIDSIWVALAGPGSNFIQALSWAILLIGLIGFGVDERFLVAMSQAGITWNLGLLVFNLFPLPPLDGGRILAGLLPARQSIALGKLEPWGFFIVLALVFTGIIGTLWMEPLIGFFQGVLYFVTLPLQMIL
jgi:Zn-dependent protease